MKSLIKSNGTLFPAIPSMLDEIFDREWLDSSLANWRDSGSTLPSVNVMETGEDFRIEVAAPGMQRGDFKVELENNILTISSEREEKSTPEEGRGNYTRREFSCQAFQRSFSLPANKVLGDKITAKYVDGILYITVPKSEEAKVKPAKQIAVS